MWGSDGGLRSFVVINYVIAGTFAAERMQDTLFASNRKAITEALTVIDLERLVLAQNYLKL